jgi:branched-chain amino acid transport system substrate-binding protein
MNTRSRTRAVAAACAVVLASSLAACGGDGAGDASGTGPIRILSVTGYTGLLASPANAVKRGMQAAVNDVNANGGIDGRDLELTTEDNQSDAQRGLTLIQKAIDSGETPDLIVPGVSSAEALAVAPLLSRQQVVGLGATSSSELDDPSKFPYYFSQSSSQESKLAVIADHLEEQGVEKVAVVVAADAMGEAVSTALEEDFADAGIEFELFTFTADAVDLSPQFSAAKSWQPDLIYMDGAGGQVAQILAGRVKAGAEDIPTLGGTSMPLLPLFDLTEGTAQLDNVEFAFEPGSVWVDPAQRSAAFTTFQQDVTAQGDLEMPLSIYGFGWDLVQTYAAALKSIDGDISQEALKDALEDLPESVTDELVLYKELFSDDAHQVQPADGDILIGRPTEQRDGQYVIEQ